MNCVPAPGIADARRRLRLLVALVITAGCAAAAPEPAAEERLYELAYTITPDPAQGTARVELSVRQPRRLLRELSMDLPASRFSGVDADGGELVRDGERVSWLPGDSGGSLRWTVRVAHLRNGRLHDAIMTKDWALFRGSDLMPPAATRTLVGARSLTTLRFELPRGWSSLTRYRERDDVYLVTNDERRFDRPSGWMLLGRIGVRFETIAGVRVLVGGPTGQDVRRLDMLAFLNWTLPQLVGVLPDFPDRLTIISASDGVWRGGLSGPASLFLHAGLPLISENGTSTLLHELMHVGMQVDSADGADWIIEGFAEYYGLEILRRSRTITARRFRAALDDLADWGSSSASLCGGESTAATTARAVAVFAGLHAELREKRSRPDPLDELLRRLVAGGDDVTLAALRRHARDIHGELPDALGARKLPGCN